MTGTVLGDTTNKTLILIIPIAAIIILLLAAWPYLLGLLFLSIVWKIWDIYQWKRLCSQINPHFRELIEDNQGCLTSLDLSLKTNLSGKTAQYFLDKKALEFGAKCQNYQDKGTVYYFLTAKALAKIFADSEPIVSMEDATPATNTETSITTPATTRTTSPVTTSSATSSEHYPEPSVEEIAKLVELEENPLNAFTDISEPSPASPDVNLESEAEITAQGEELGNKASLADIFDDTDDLEENLPEPSNITEDGTSKAQKLGSLFGSVADNPATAAESLTKDAIMPLNQSDLAKRLDVHSIAVSKRKLDRDFIDWSQSKDPDGVAWQYSRKTKMFTPIIN